MIKNLTRFLCSLMLLGGSASVTASDLSGSLYCDANHNKIIDNNDFSIEGKVTAVIDSIINLNGDNNTNVGDTFSGMTNGTGDYSFSLAYPATANYTATISQLALNGISINNPTFIMPSSSSATFSIANTGDNHQIDWLVDSRDCQILEFYCGDGNQDPGEECDDGNHNNFDGCSANCTIEYSCGDGIKDPGEQCDDGNNQDFDGCSANCTIEPYCGDEHLDPNEECDDGNNNDFDGCSANCTIESFCGDGHLDANEECDDGNKNDADGCSANCTIEPFCGDGTRDPNEGCDDGNIINGDGCSANCTIESFCGDGVLDNGEQCDDGNKMDGDGCSSNCTIEPYCGDGTVDPGEQCDDGNNMNGDGCSATCGNEQGGQGCTPGYWKQSQHFDSWNGYTPDTMFASVFDNAFPGMTLLDVMKQGGGKLKALGRHTVAALLNSVSTGVNYDRSEAQVISMFNNAYPGKSKNYNSTKNTLETFNEQGCPLN